MEEFKEPEAQRAPKKSEPGLAGAGPPSGWDRRKAAASCYVVSSSCVGASSLRAS